jgi:hypothetical protein
LISSILQRLSCIVCRRAGLIKGLSEAQAAQLRQRFIDQALQLFPASKRRRTGGGGVAAGAAGGGAGRSCCRLLAAGQTQRRAAQRRLGGVVT